MAAPALRSRQGGGKKQEADAKVPLKSHREPPSEQTNPPERCVQPRHGRNRPPAPPQPSAKREPPKLPRNSLKLRGPSSSACGHCALGELCSGLSASLVLFSSWFLGDGDPERAAGTFLRSGEPGWARPLAKPGGDLMALLTGPSGGRSAALASASSAGRGEAAEGSLGEADFLPRAGEMGPPSALPFCFISS